MNLRAAVARLLAAPELQALEERLRDQSVFHLLAVHDRERSHAAFLGWLLDPMGSHGMGPAPLRRFLLMAAGLAKTGAMLDVVDVDGLDLDAVRIATEVTIEGKRRLDLVVIDDGDSAYRTASGTATAPTAAQAQAAL